MYYGFLRFVLVSFVAVQGLGATANASELNDQMLLVAKPFAQPLRPTNSTFRGGLRVPHSYRKLPLGQDAPRPQQASQPLNPQRFPTSLTRRVGQGPHVNTAVAPTAPANVQSADDVRFQWKPALAQAMKFLWIEHAFRFMTEPGTRAELRGPFFKDWYNSARRTRGWRDGDPFIVNYVGHPMQGSVTNYIYIQNDPRSRQLEAGFSKAYFKSRLKAMLFSTIYSTQFELGPLSESSLGNVGMKPSRLSQHPSAFVDLVVTPTLGTAWMMGEDALDRAVVKRMENHVENRFVRLMVRGFLNPSRSFANVLRGRWPWYRDGRRL